MSAETGDREKFYLYPNIQGHSPLAAHPHTFSNHLVNPETDKPNNAASGFSIFFLSSQIDLRHISPITIERGSI